MFESLETGLGLDIILWFQELRFNLLDSLLHILHFAGDDLFFIAAFGIIYWLFNKRLGMRMVFALVVIGLVNYAFKDLFARPRPYEVSDAFTPLVTEESYGMPSGHVATSLMVWGYLAISLKKRWVTIGVIIFVALQFFGRMIAGVHFPQDVVAGVIVAGITLAIYAAYAEKVVDFWKAQSLPMQIAIPVLISILGLIVINVIPLEQSQIDDYGTFLGLLWGAGLAAAIEPLYIRFQAQEAIMIRLLQYVVGIVLAVILLMGLGVAFDAITETGVLAAILRVTRYGLVTAFALALWPYLSIKLNLMRAEAES